MKITRTQLRSIIKEATGRGPNKFQREVAMLEQQYPKSVAWSKDEEDIMMTHWKHVTDPRNGKSPYRNLEKAIVYDALASAGPDVSFSRVGKLLGKIRKALGTGTILDAYEQQGRAPIVQALEDIGMLGYESDTLRAPADRYY